MSRGDGAGWMSSRRLLTSVVTGVIAAVLLWWSLRDVDWDQLREVLAGADLALIGLAVVALSASYFTRAIRWRVLLSARAPVPVVTVFWATCAGYLGNQFLPAKAGELIRCVLLSRRQAMPLSFVLATGITERVMDLLALAIIGVIALLAHGGLPRWFEAGLQATAIIGVVGLALVLLAPRLSSTVKRVIRAIPMRAGIAERVIRLLRQFVLGLRALAEPRRGIAFLVLTVGIWVADGGIAMLVAASLDLTLSLPEALLLLAGLGLASAAPSTPGYLGLFQFVAVSMLVPFGYDASEAIAMILVFQAVIVIVVAFWGTIGLAVLSPGRRGLPSIPDVESSARELAGDVSGQV